MKAYISLDAAARKLLGKEIIALGMALNSANVEQFIFADKYSWEVGEESEMLENAMKHIDSCNFIIAETSHLNVTTCVELGYAKAKRKPIVYLQKEGIEVNEIIYALSNFHIIYSNPKDLYDQLSEFLKNILPQQ